MVKSGELELEALARVGTVRADPEPTETASSMKPTSVCYADARG